MIDASKALYSWTLIRRILKQAEIEPGEHLEDGIEAIEDLILEKIESEQKQAA